MAANAAGRKVLVGILADPGVAPEARAGACWVLGNYQRTKQPAGALAALVVDGTEPPSLRVEAARAIASLGAREAYEALVEVLADPAEEPRVREPVAEALGATMEETAVEPLLATLLDRTTDDGVRAACARALAHHDVADLAEAMFAGVGERDARLRFWCLFALGELATRSAADAGEVMETAEAVGQHDDRVIRGFWSVRRQAHDVSARARQAVYPVDTPATLAALVGPQVAEDAAVAFAERAVRGAKLPSERVEEVSKEVLFEAGDEDVTAFFPWLDARVPQAWDGTPEDLLGAATVAGERMGTKLAAKGLLGLQPWRNPAG